MINVRIKQLPPRTPGGVPFSATTKVLLRGSADVRDGCRALEPGEVVALEDEEAMKALAALPFELEMTLDKPTRPLFYRNVDEGALTSQYFNPSSAGRAEQAKVAMAHAMEEANNPENVAEMDRINALEAREAAIHARELELGLVPASVDEAIGDELDEDLKNYEPSNNTMSDGELKEVRTAAEAERDDEPVKGAATTPETVTAAPRRRRRQASA